MKLAVDSSSFAKRYVQEGGSDQLDRLLEKASELAFCVILVPEIVSGLNRRLREQVLTIADYRAIKKQLLEFEIFFHLEFLFVKDLALDNQ